MQFVVFVFSFLFLIISVAADFQPTPQNEFFKTSPEDIRSNQIVFFVPGLNFNSQRFDSFERDLQAQNIQTYRLFLRYSSYRPGPWRSQNLAKVWQTEFSRAIGYFAQECRQNPQLEITLVAYSLGTIVSENVLQSMNEIPSCFKKSIHFAPAYQINPWLQPVLASTYILYSGIHIPSYNVENYQTKAFTYVGEYEGLRDNIKQLESIPPKKIDLAHTLVISKNDELVDVEYAIEFSQKIRQDFQILFVKEEREGLVGKYHLIIDEHSLNQTDYQEVMKLF
ncbi:MAG: hypothetical protein VX642_06505 [Bdellovibrionota bacterium]|nr:hypothetical protein [Bdellovibrionota bacterium]